MRLRRYWRSGATADSGDDRGDDLVTQDEERGDGAGGVRRDLVAARVPRLDGQVLAAHLAEIIGRLADGVAGHPGHPPDRGGMLGDGEPAGGGGKGQRRRQGSPDAGLVQVDAAGPDRADPRRQRQLVQQPVGDEAGVGAVQRGGEPAGDAGERRVDAGEVVEAAAAAQGTGVVDGGLQAQDVLALGVGLDLELAEQDPEPGQAEVWRCISSVRMTRGCGLPPLSADSCD